MRVSSRGAVGYSQAKRVTDMTGIPKMLEEGPSLGDLWMKGHFDVGAPLAAETGQ